jgi:hypothetical protein
MGGLVPRPLRQPDEYRVVRLPEPALSDGLYEGSLVPSFGGTEPIPPEFNRVWRSRGRPEPDQFLTPRDHLSR